MMHPLPPRRVKVAIVGETGAGKSAIVQRLVRNLFDPTYACTIGAAFGVAERGNVRLELWDTAGQERYRSLTPMYFRGADVVWNVAAVDEAPWRSWQLWEREVRRVNGRCLILRIMSKMDLAPPTRQVPPGVVSSCARREGGCAAVVAATLAGLAELAEQQREQESEASPLLEITAEEPRRQLSCCWI